MFLLSSMMFLGKEEWNIIILFVVLDEGRSKDFVGGREDVSIRR